MNDQIRRNTIRLIDEQEQIVRCARPEEYNLNMSEIMDYLQREG